MLNAFRRGPRPVYGAGPANEPVATRERLSDPELHRALIVEEYRAMRAKSSEARSNQQTILQWSLAAYGVITAGVLAGLARDQQPREFQMAVVVTLTTVLPLVSLAAFAFWLSEVGRMLRAARYLRERENSLIRGLSERVPQKRVSKSTAEMFDEYPLVWENLILLPTWKGQADLGPIAVTLIYLSLTLVSTVTGMSLAAQVEGLPILGLIFLRGIGALMTASVVLLAAWGLMSSLRERSRGSAIE